MASELSLLDDLSKSNSSFKSNDSIYDQLANFDRLRISALTKAAEISPLIKNVTIGPNSPINKEILLEEDDIKSKTQPKKDAEIEDLNGDPIGQDLRFTIRLKEYRAKLQENTEEVFKTLVEQMVARRADTMRRFWTTQSEDCERRALELKARKLKMLRELQDNDNVSVLEKAKLDEKNSQLINRQTIESMNKILEEQNKAAARFASITDSHTKICFCYNEINSLLQNEPFAKSVCDRYIITLNSVIGNINAILDLCNTGSISEKEVKQAEILASSIDNIKKKIVDGINEMKEEVLLKKKQEEEIKRKQEEEEAKKKQIEKQKELEKQNLFEQEKLKLAEQSKIKTKPMFYSPKNFSYYEELRKFLIQYENQYKDLVENKVYKKFKLDCQKAVNTPANTISNVSGAHLKDKYDKLSQLLKGANVQVLDTLVQATQHPQGLAFVTSLLAKKMVKLGELLVSSSPEAAYSIASVAVALLTEFPDFAKLLEANFHRECPYIVPMYLPQIEGQTDKDFYISRGYKYNEDGEVEKQNMFLKRMSGIFRLRCAIWIAKPPRFINTPNPQGLKCAWQWLASFINLKPEPDISATLINDFLAVCGSECSKSYGRQFTKMIKVISTQYMPILDNVDTGGPKSRLEDFLQNVLKTGHIPLPNRQSAQYTW